MGSPLAGKLFVVLGAGGAGKSLAYGAAQKGARVVVANRTLGMVMIFGGTTVFSHLQFGSLIEVECSIPRSCVFLCYFRTRERTR